MKYKPERQEKMVHALFGGVQTEPKEHLCYKIRVGSLDNKYLCNFDALDSDVICHAVPKATGGIWSEELNKMGIKLSDKSESPVDILIGADIAGKIITGKKRILRMVWSAMLYLEIQLISICYAMNLIFPTYGD